MNKLILTLFIVFFYSNLNAQTSNPYLIFGILNEDGLGGTEVSSYCGLGGYKDIEQNKPFLIAGTNKCQSSISSKDFYEIVYNNKIYFIDKASVTTSKDDQWDLIASMSSEEADSLHKSAVENAAILYRSDGNKITSFLAKTKSQGLAILNWTYLDESEYTEGTSVKVEVYNPTSKTIKYIWFGFTGYNAVGDKIISRGSSLKTVRGIGPIKPSASASYEFDYVWFTDLVETAKISTLKVQYMDGTMKTIAVPKSIILPNNLYTILSDGE